MIQKSLLQLIEPHFHNELIEKEYKIKTLKAKDLLVHTRFDLAFKILYLENINKKVKFAHRFYKEHIRAFSLGNFKELGNKEKNNIAKYIKNFHEIYKDIKLNGFDSSKTLIPLSSKGYIANGAHRVASAIYTNKNLKCVEIDTTNPNYNYKFFYNRNISSKILDTVATKFVEYANNIYIALIWPTAQGHDNEIEQIIPNIVYRKDILLNPNGAHNLISQVYYGEKWLGNIKNNFIGSQGKLVECFKNFNPVKVIAFQANNLNEVMDVKNKIRKIFNIGKSSIHINDTRNEAIRVARVLFNDNSIHFLNNAKFCRYISTRTKIDEFKKFINKNKLNTDDIIIDSSLILSCYGIREAKDTDFIYNSENKIKFKFNNINIHNEVLKNYKLLKNELIYNPNNYFYFNELKFVSFDNLYKMKKSRNETKDKNDCKMMEAFMENNQIKIVINRLKQNFYYIIIKLKYKFILLLKILRLHKIIKKLILYEASNK